VTYCELVLHAVTYINKLVMLLGDIAIDDISITGGTCSNVPAYSNPADDLIQASCMFNSATLCYGWSNTNWTISNASTPSANTGPQSDHTNNNGHYAFAESSLPYQTGDKAILSKTHLSPTLAYAGSSTKFPDGLCVEFWYHMYGPHIGTLSVYVDTYNQQRLRWSKTGTQGNKWKKANIYISTFYNFDISFEAVKGKGWSGDIAIDDISVY